MHSTLGCALMLLHAAMADRFSGTIREAVFLAANTSTPPFSFFGMETETGPVDLARTNTTFSGAVDTAVVVDGNMLAGHMLEPSTWLTVQAAVPVQMPPISPCHMLHIVVTTSNDNENGFVTSAFERGNAVEHTLNRISSGAMQMSVHPMHVVAPPNANACDYVELTNIALLQVSNVSAYQYIVTTFPTTYGGLDESGRSNCQIDGIVFAGLAYVGGKYSWVRTNEVNMYTMEYSTTILHELGHNFGLRHAKTIESEYGDPHCLMGHGNELVGTGTYGGGMLYALGWAEGNKLADGMARARTVGANQSVVVVNNDIVVSFRGANGGADFGVPPQYHNVMIVQRLNEKRETLFLHAGDEPWEYGTNEIVARRTGIGQWDVYLQPVVVERRMSVVYIGIGVGVVVGILVGRRARARRRQLRANAGSNNKLQIRTIDCSNHP